MGLQIPHALGRQERLEVTQEATYGTFVKPVSANAMKVWQVKLHLDQERVNRGDKRQGRSQVERITRRKVGTFSVEKYLIPSGTAGTKPDDHYLWTNCYGVETVTGGTSVAYTLNDTQAGRASVSITNEVSGVLSQIGVGCNVDKHDVKWSGGTEPMITWSGSLSDLYTTGYSTLAANITSSNQAQVQAADIDDFQVGSLVSVGANNNAGAGYLVTAINVSTHTLTLDATIASSSSGDAVAPFIPAETTTGHPSNEIQGSVTIDGTNVKVLEGTISVSNNDKVINDEYGTAASTDVIPGYRDVTGTFKLRARRDTVIYLAHRQTFATHAAVVTFGTTAGLIATCSLPQIEFKFSDFEIPQSEEVTFELPWVALASADGAHDEISWSFT